MGHKVLLPTTNIVPAKEKLMPPNGVYDTVSHFKDRTLCGITNVGYKPTIGEKFLGVETYLLTARRICTESPSRVEFFHYSRPEKRFSSIEALKQQLLKDAEKGKAYFRSLENKNFREKLFEKTVYRSETVCYTVRGEKSQYSEAGDSDHFLIPGV